MEFRLKFAPRDVLRQMLLISLLSLRLTLYLSLELFSFFELLHLSDISGFMIKLGREPWSSGYGRRLTEGRGFESQCRILDRHFHINLL